MSTTLEREIANFSAPRSTETLNLYFEYELLKEWLQKVRIIPSLYIGPPTKYYSYKPSISTLVGGLRTGGGKARYD